jgi:hypothetical protein
MHELDDSTLCKGFLIDMDLALQRGDHVHEREKSVSSILVNSFELIRSPGNLAFHLEAPITSLGSKKKLYPCSLR